jgi:hypothetical protein
LDDYIQNRKLPELSVNYKDEAGILMRNIQFTLTELNNLLEETKDLTALLTQDLRPSVFEASPPVLNTDVLLLFATAGIDTASLGIGIFYRGYSR